MSWQTPRNSRIGSFRRRYFFSKRGAVPTSFDIEGDTIRPVAYPDNRRVGLEVQNSSPAEVYLDFDRPANSRTSIIIPAGGSYSVTNAPVTNAIYVRGSIAAKQRITVVEYF